MHDRSIDLARIATASNDDTDVPLWRRLMLPVLVGFAVALPLWLLVLGAVVLWAAWIGQPL